MQKWTQSITRPKRFFGSEQGIQGSLKEGRPMKIKGVKVGLKNNGGIVNFSNSTFKLYTDESLRIIDSDGNATGVVTAGSWAWCSVYEEKAEMA